MPKFELIDFQCFTDERGSLIPFEMDDDFPFEVKRVYLVTARNGQIRGGHAHQIESELFVAASGSVTAVVNDGSGDQKIILDQKSRGLLVGVECWHEFHDFSPDAVLLCFSSIHYLPGKTNYMSDKNQFLAAKING